MTDQFSEQYQEVYETEPPEKNETYDTTGRHRIARFDFTQTDEDGAVGSTATLLKIVGARGRILADLSFIYFSAFGAARTLDIGFREHKESNPPHTVVPEDADFFNTDLDVSAAGSANIGTNQQNAADGGAYAFDAQDGLIVFATVGGDTIPQGATLKGQIAYVVD